MTSSLLPKTPAGASAGAELVTSDGRSLALVGAKLVGEAQGSSATRSTRPSGAPSIQGDRV